MLLSAHRRCKKVTCKKSSLSSRKNMSNDSFLNLQDDPVVKRTYVYANCNSVRRPDGMVIKPRVCMQQAACANTQLGGKSHAFRHRRQKKNNDGTKGRVEGSRPSLAERFSFPTWRKINKGCVVYIWFCSKFATGHCLQSVRVPFDGYMGRARRRNTIAAPSNARQTPEMMKLTFHLRERAKYIIRYIICTLWKWLHSNNELGQMTRSAVGQWAFEVDWREI